MQDNVKGYEGKHMMSASRDYYLSGHKKVMMYPGRMQQNLVIYCSDLLYTEMVYIVPQHNNFS